ncbi:MAG: hypothetical protein CV087_24335 [Candidatus Brocadia sp. WS118]|nr:MAG: hypothetical protein CV087_24335 [Candidatus Brocadia sp. WS118]
MKHRFLSTIITFFIFLLSIQISPAQTQYEVHFACDMEGQILLGNFDPTSPDDRVYVRGIFNGWGTGDEMFDPDNNAIYTATVFMDLIPDTLVPYKFFYTHNNNGTIVGWWEHGIEKIFAVAGCEADTNGNSVPDFQVGPRYFDDGFFIDGFFYTPTDIIFQVDIQPALAYLTAFDSIPFGGTTITSIDCVYIAGDAGNTTPQMQWIWELPPGDPTREVLQMNDSGQNGDLVAGDNIWTITINFGFLAPAFPTYKFSLNGFDNESRPFEHHREEVDNLPGNQQFDEFGEPPGSIGYHCVWSYSLTAIGPHPFQVSQKFELLQNYPNPFNSSTTIHYYLPETSPVKLVIYDIVGKRIFSLVNQTQIPGWHTVQYEGINQSGQAVSSGIYLARLEAGQYSASRKMILLK